MALLLLKQESDAIPWIAGFEKGCCVSARYKLCRVLVKEVYRKNDEEEISDPHQHKFELGPLHLARHLPCLSSSFASSGNPEAMHFVAFLNPQQGPDTPMN
ncbi:hypothetical protein QOT17_011904 [Balamuthia mandrillaris]